MNSFVMNTVSNAVALAAVDMVDPIIPNTGSTTTAQYLRRGALWSLADEGVDIYFTGTSLLREGDWLGYADKVVWNGMVNYAVDASNVAVNLYDQFSYLNPLGDRVGTALLSGAIKAASDATGRMIDVAYPDSVFHYATHAVTDAKKNFGW